MRKWSKGWQITSKGLRFNYLSCHGAINDKLSVWLRTLLQGGCVRILMSAVSESGQRDKQSRDLGKNKKTDMFCHFHTLLSSWPQLRINILVSLLPVKMHSDVLLAAKERTTLFLRTPTHSKLYVQLCSDSFVLSCCFHFSSLRSLAPWLTL